MIALPAMPTIHCTCSDYPSNAVGMHCTNTAGDCRDNAIVEAHY